MKISTMKDIAVIGLAVYLVYKVSGFFKFGFKKARETWEEKNIADGGEGIDRTEYVNEKHEEIKNESKDKSSIVQNWINRNLEE